MLSSSASLAKISSISKLCHITSSHLSVRLNVKRKRGKLKDRARRGLSSDMLTMPLKKMKTTVRKMLLVRLLKLSEIFI